MAIYLLCTCIAAAAVAVAVATTLKIHSYKETRWYTQRNEEQEGEKERNQTPKSSSKSIVTHEQLYFHNKCHRVLNIMANARAHRLLKLFFAAIKTVPYDSPY